LALNLFKEGGNKMRLDRKVWGKVLAFIELKPKLERIAASIDDGALSKRIQRAVRRGIEGCKRK